MVAGLVGVAAPWLARAQTASAPRPAPPVQGPTIGFLAREDAGVLTRPGQAFLAALADAGYVPQRNLNIEYRFAQDSDDRLAQFAAELVKLQPAAIFAAGMGAAYAAKAATTSVPIVFAASTDGMDSGGSIGDTAQLRRNVTGAGMERPADTETQRLTLLREIVPPVAGKASKMGALIRPTFPEVTGQFVALQSAAQKMGIALAVMPATTSADIELAFAHLAGDGARAVIVCDDPFPANLRQDLVAAAARHKLPACYALPAFVDAGGLMSFGPDLTAAYRAAAGQLGRILKGAKPEDIPLEHPAQLKLMLNLGVARAQGITIPQAVLDRATETID